MPAVRIEFHPAAIDEAQAAHAWYEARSAAAAAAFLAEVEHAIELIAADPQRWPAHRLGTRRLVLRRFPFSIVYRLSDAAALVLAVSHVRRRPSYWRGRL